MSGRGKLTHWFMTFRMYIFNIIIFINSIFVRQNYGLTICINQLLNILINCTKMFHDRFKFKLKCIKHMHYKYRQKVLFLLCQPTLYNVATWPGRTFSVSCEQSDSINIQECWLFKINPLSEIFTGIWSVIIGPYTAKWNRPVKCIPFTSYLIVSLSQISDLFLPIKYCIKK